MHESGNEEVYEELVDHLEASKSSKDEELLFLQDSSSSLLSPISNSNSNAEAENESHNPSSPHNYSVGGGDEPLAEPINLVLCEEGRSWAGSFVWRPW